ncbi:hypothetical protein DN752_19570 [Echinicola strongylocentroti]|uniref:Uncharacterized protein n=1 Tax=Echinicola strongylocentroti TaxID=1795355 RepID=A0A2Z4IM13_9BACT|nr:hypothetical protein [Echinicola strongylocentroti]AWW32161.1 hypothetical protein DN752_19570 [Echinicola strongylocentroti]
MNNQELTEARKLLLNWLENKLHAYSGLRQKEKMSKQEKMEWPIITEGAYKDKAWMTIGRLDLILSRGCSGDYGDFTSLNRNTLRSWVNQFYRDNQNDLDKEMRKEIAKTRSEREKEVEYWYELGLRKFKETYTRLKGELKGKEDISYHSIPQDIEYADVWWKVFEEAGLIGCTPEIMDGMLKAQQRQMDAEVNNNKEFHTTVHPMSVTKRVNNILVRMEVAKWIMQDVDIDDLFREFKVESIRKRNFFSDLSTKS